MSMDLVRTQDPNFIAISPPSGEGTHYDSETCPLLSFESSQFDVIYPRQRNPKNDPYKSAYMRSRFIHLPNAFECSRWGSFIRLSLTHEDSAIGAHHLESIKREKVLGQFTASALAGNAVLGSVFYALPAVVAVGGVYSPISLTVASFILFLWRPIMEELASALPIRGAPYSFILNVSTKPLALVSASLLLLDYASTVVVSAATASTYLAGEIHLPFPSWVGATVIVIIFVCISLSGIRESARIALAMLSFHIVTMLVLMIAAGVHWGYVGSSQLWDNWNAGRTQDGTSVSAVLKQVYYGFSLGMLGLTGFECTPAYIVRIKEGRFPSVLRNLHLPAIFLSGMVMLLVLALVPLDVILAGANVLSVLGLKAAGPWLRVLIVIDAIVVLCGGVLTGILSSCELLQQLAQDRAIPAVYLKALPITGAPFVSIFSFAMFCGLIYASAGGRLDIVSQMFGLVWLTVMALFPLSLLLLKYNCGRLKRDKRASLLTIFFAMLIVAVSIAGNIAINPKTFEYFGVYSLGITFLFLLTQNKAHLVQCLFWIYDQYPLLHRWKRTRDWGSSLVNATRRLKRQPVCILVNNDEISQWFHMALYARNNEETSNIKIIHFHDGETEPSSEFEANVKILDEAFLDLTIDLILVPGIFEPQAVAALAHKLGIPTTLMFMGCPSSKRKYSVAEFGTRIIPV